VLGADSCHFYSFFIMCNAVPKAGWPVRMLLVGALFVASSGACSSETDGAHQSRASGQKANIMPLGDSITESSQGLPSYRFYLWHLAIAAGYRIDFVGSRHGVANGPPANPDFDSDHEGHSGWRADEILAHIHPWAAEASPDVVLIHLGHNDLCRGQSIASTAGDIGGIIDELRSVNPSVQILLAQVIPSSSTCHARIPSLNAELSQLAADKSRAESPVVLVDQYTGFDPSTMTYDGTHPLPSGESRMADRWFDRLAPLLDALGAGS
jgi:hypothetical protein